MLKKYILSFLLVACTLSLGFSQPQKNDQRTVETKVADIVMLLPAKNTADFNRLMENLINLGDIIPTLSTKLTEPGKANDDQIRSAIAGMATYAGKTNDAKRKSVAEGICKSIAQASSDEIRDFLLIQLQYVASDESVNEVAKYLTNDRLCDAAARVLVRINSASSNKTLFDAFAKANPKNQLTIIESLGLVKYAPALDIITPLANNTDVNVRKVALFALANIASPASEPVLKAAAEKAKYSYEQSDALASYILLLTNLNNNGNKNIALNAAKQMLKTTVEPAQTHAKSVALKFITLTANEKEAISEIIKALDSKDKKYREAALLYSTNIKSAEMFKALLKKAEKEKRPEVKADIITAFGVRGDKEAFDFVTKTLQKGYSPSKKETYEVTKAAITTAAKLGGEKAITPILNTMTGAVDQSIANTAKATLLTLSSSSFNSNIAKLISSKNELSNIAYLDILAERNATDQADVVFANITTNCTNNDKVSVVAAKALKNVVTQKDIARIAKLMNETPASCNDKIAAYQEALYAAVSSITNKEEQTRLVVEQLNNSANKNVYYNTLAMIGGNAALSIVSKAFESGDNQSKTAAFESMTRWSDFSAAEELYRICKNNPNGEYFDKALMSYISKINPSNNTADQKLLLLRRVLSVAKANEQKNEIIKQIGRTGTFLAMITAGNYLDDASLQQTAAQTVMSIALRNNSYYGKLVTDLLNKVIAINKHPEAEYQKQAILKHLASLPNGDGWVSMFNGKDLTGWKGLVENPIARAKMTSKELAEKQVKADEIMRRDWRVENGLLVFDGKGYDNLCSEKSYGDFEMVIDWRIEPEGDAGIYLRGSPQVQIWDTSLVKVGAQVGSGGLYNNQKNPSKPLLVADNAVEQWNTFRIRMVGDKVTVYLNGKLVTDNVILENYWDRKQPIFPEDAIELQAHGTRVEYRDVYICEIPRPKAYTVSAEETAEGFVPMFNGIDMNGWVGNTTDYFAENGEIVCDPKRKGNGNLYTEKEYSDFIMRFEFQLTPAANNGLGIRTPLEGDAAYVGMELQILDSEADVYKDLKPYQYHGSVYGVIPAKRGYLKPVGEWNVQEVYAKGSHIKVTLNGVVILEGDIAKASKNFTETMDKLKHPGLSNKSGHIGFLGHGSYLKFKNLRIKDLTAIPSVKKGKKR